MSRNKLKRKQDKQKKHRQADRAKLLKKRNTLMKNRKEEKETARLQRDIERLKNRIGGSTIRKDNNKISEETVTEKEL